MKVAFILPKHTKCDGLLYMTNLTVSLSRTFARCTRNSKARAMHQAASRSIRNAACPVVQHCPNAGSGGGRRVGEAHPTTKCERSERSNGARSAPGTLSTYRFGCEASQK